MRYGLLFDPNTWNSGQTQGGSSANLLPKMPVVGLDTNVTLDKTAKGDVVMDRADPEMTVGGWLDDEMISGFKNKYLLVAGGLLVTGAAFLLLKKKTKMAGYRRRSRR